MSPKNGFLVSRLQTWQNAASALLVSHCQFTVTDLTFVLLKLIYPDFANSVDPDQLASEEAN